MDRDEVLRAIGKLSPADREAIRLLLNMRHDNDTGGERLREKLRLEAEDDGA